MAKGRTGGQVVIGFPIVSIIFALPWSSFVCVSLSLSHSLSVSLSPLFVNVIQCVVLCLSLLKNSPLSYHFCFFFLFRPAFSLSRLVICFFLRSFRQCDWFTFYNSTHFAILLLFTFTFSLLLL